MHKCGCGAEYKVTATEVSTDYVTGEKCGTLIDQPTRALRLTGTCRETMICSKRVRGDQAVMWLQRVIQASREELFWQRRIE